MKKYKFVCTLGIGDVIWQVLAWVLLAVITVGIALPLFPYFFARLLINSTEIQEVGNGAT